MSKWQLYCLLCGFVLLRGLISGGFHIEYVYGVNCIHIGEIHNEYIWSTYECGIMRIK